MEKLPKRGAVCAPRELKINISFPHRLSKLIAIKYQIVLEMRM